jgi:hypothetical protein
MPAPPAATITVKETLGLLDGAFSETAIALVDGQYALWLGSGISFDRMPALHGLVKKMLEALRTQIDPVNPDCRFKKSLDEVMALANLKLDEKPHISYAAAVDTWKDVDPIVNRLVSQYGQVLDQAPEGEEVDYLLWTILDVVGTYGNAAIRPDAEHLCIGALIMEGAVSDLASANWDGLIEKAVSELSGGANLLRVCVLPEDMQLPLRQASLYKFHGCAVLAGVDSVRYRKKIVGRKSQISGWVQKNENMVMAAKLIDLARTRPTLMLGLSAQDHNIQELFVAAQQTMNWSWPSHPPAYVFSENALGADQKALLRNVYYADYTPGRAPAMTQSALLQAYAKPLLIAFWLYVLAAKAQFLVGAIAAPNLAAADRLKLQEGIKALRDHSGAACPPTNRETFMRWALLLVRRALTFFREGKEADSTGAGYQAASPFGPSRMADDAALPGSGMPELATALAVIGAVLDRGDWTPCTTGSAMRTPGAFRLETTAGTSADLFFVANAQSALVLSNEGHAPDDEGVVVVHSHEVTKPMPRSPRPRRGRTGHAGRREVSMRTLIAAAANADDLVQRFRREAGL